MYRLAMVLSGFAILFGPLGLTKLGIAGPARLLFFMAAAFALVCLAIGPLDRDRLTNITRK